MSDDGQRRSFVEQAEVEVIQLPTADLFFGRHFTVQTRGNYAVVHVPGMQSITIPPDQEWEFTVKYDARRQR